MQLFSHIFRVCAIGHNIRFPIADWEILDTNFLVANFWLLKTLFEHFRLIRTTNKANTIVGAFSMLKLKLNAPKAVGAYCRSPVSSLKSKI